MKKIKWLDTLRGCACLIVLCTHIIARHPTLGVYVSGCGKIGVWLFMLLSGLLLMLPVACGEKQFKYADILSFYEKKVVRIYPAFLFALLFSMALGLLNISGVKNILLFRGTYGHLWYIPVIIAFYLSAPILLLLFSWINAKLPQTIGRYITTAVLVMIILVDAFAFPFTSYPENSIEIKWYYCVFAMGMLLAVVFPLLENKSKAWMVWLVPIGVILILIKTPLAREMIGGYPPGGYLQNKYLYMSFSWSLIIIGIAGSRSVKAVLEKCAILQRIAIISYEVYLVHYFILDYINPMVYGHMRIKGIITIVASIGISFLLHWTIERGKRMAGIHKAFIVTIAAVTLILGGAFGIEHSANAEDDRLYVPTMISKWGDSLYTVRNTCFVWCQGESDGDAGASEQSYSQQLNLLVNGVEELGVNQVFVIGIGEKQGEAPNDNHEIREAQEAYCDTHANCTMVASFYGMAGYQKDDYHYTQEGYNRIGEEAGKKAALALQED